MQKLHVLTTLTAATAEAAEQLDYSRRSRRSLRLNLQLEALDLAGLGFGQRVHELHRSRVLVGRDLRFDVVLQPLRTRFVPLDACLQNDMRLHDLSPLIVRYADHGALDHVSVRKER